MPTTGSAVNLMNPRFDSCSSCRVITDSACAMLCGLGHGLLSCRSQDDLIYGTDGACCGQISCHRTCEGNHPRGLAGAHTNRSPKRQNRVETCKWGFEWWNVRWRAFVVFRRTVSPETNFIEMVSSLGLNRHIGRKLDGIFYISLADLTRSSAVSQSCSVFRKHSPPHYKNDAAVAAMIQLTRVGLHRSQFSLRFLLVFSLGNTGRGTLCLWDTGSNSLGLWTFWLSSYHEAQGMALKACLVGAACTPVGVRDQQQRLLCEKLSFLYMRMLLGVAPP
eukprot:286616-Amphidinium_carterae.1